MERQVLSFLRTFAFAAFVLGLACSLVACRPENGINGGTIDSGVVPEISVPDGYVNYFIEDLSFSRSGGEVKVPFQINVDWTMVVVGSPSWCIVEPASGTAGLHKVMVRVAANETYAPRSAKIHLLCGTSKVAEIVVVQDYEYAVLLSRRDYNVSYEATTIDVEVKSNLDFEYTISDADWVRVSSETTRGLSTHYLSFEVKENDTRAVREAYILFYNSAYAVADTLILVQDSNPDAVPYQVVDLGLSVKWSSCNVGANSPEEYGGYYAWGEIEEKDYYDWSTYKWCNGSEDSQSKYCTSSSYGIVDNKTTLDPEDDVAHVQWGGSWRMPTKAEQDELCNECSWSWTSVNGINGYRVTGPNGNSIFLPATGYCYGDNVNYRGMYGYFWSSTLCEYNNSLAYSFGFYDGHYGWYVNSRYCGRCVRPVIE